MKRAIRRRVRLIKKSTHLDADACVFCGSTKMSDEHVFPRWMHKFLPPRTAGRGASVRISEEGPHRTDVVDNHRLRGPIRDWQIRSVCGNYSGCCNNEWMRDIELQAQAVMEPMLRGEQIRLSEVDQKIIATWAILKVMVVHHRFVHHAQRKQMRAKREPPKRWSVWIAAYGGKIEDGHWIVRPLALDPPGSKRRPNRVGAAPTGHATTQVVKNLFIHVVKVPMDDFGLRWRWHDHFESPIRGQILRIWPPSGNSYLWPQKALRAGEAMAIADALHNALVRLGREQGVLPPKN